jgi:hypothetical protein
VNWKIWLPVLLSIPTSIIAGLCVGPIQRWFQGWGLTREAARKERSERDMRDTLDFFNVPERFTQYLISAAIRMLLPLVIFLGGMMMMFMADFALVMIRTSGKPYPVNDPNILRGGAIFGYFVACAAIVLFLARYSSVSYKCDFIKSFRDSRRDLKRERKGEQ